MEVGASDRHGVDLESTTESPGCSSQKQRPLHSKIFLTRQTDPTALGPHPFVADTMVLHVQQEAHKKSLQDQCRMHQCVWTWTSAKTLEDWIWNIQIVRPNNDR
jgi:hypothetical protein